MCPWSVCITSVYLQRIPWITSFLTIKRPNETELITNDNQTYNFSVDFDHTEISDWTSYQLPPPLKTSKFPSQCVEFHLTPRPVDIRSTSYFITSIDALGIHRGTCLSVCRWADLLAIINSLIRHSISAEDWIAWFFVSICLAVYIDYEHWRNQFFLMCSRARTHVRMATWCRI